jgi:hypothetical protein
MVFEPSISYRPEPPMIPTDAFCMIPPLIKQI